ncbi:hypothetical protein [Allorhodopirellula heiligendammensis]|uniref:hypothetical protein n=1 Tax=Allorhodopirellula heiligendammensis TaxID=2714739 RepID=UPI00265FEF31|nr:hypothetical protein [Allorhodopirellula heiligendammensis]
MSVAVLLLAVAFAKERRLRMALQQILKRLVQRWRPDEPEPDYAPIHDDDRDAFDSRVPRK